MTRNKKISPGLSLTKIVSIIVMSLCLLFLTGVNFFVYPSSGMSYGKYMGPETGDEETPAPVEEKSSSKTGLTIQEEYIHDHNLTKDLSAFIILSKHKIPAEEKLQIVHFELISPPPKA